MQLFAEVITCDHSYWLNSSYSSAACRLCQRSSHVFIRVGSSPRSSAACPLSHMCHLHVSYPCSSAACRLSHMPPPPCTRTHAHTHGIILSDAFLACRLDFNNQRSAPPNGWRQLLTPSRRLRMRRDAETHVRSHRSRCQEPPGDTEPRASLNHSHRCPDCLGTAKLSLAGSSPWERNAQLQSATDIGQAPQSCTHLTTKSRWNTRASASLIRSLV